MKLKSSFQAFLIRLKCRFVFVQSLAVFVGSIWYRTRCLLRVLQPRWTIGNIKKVAIASSIGNVSINVPINARFVHLAMFQSRSLHLPLALKRLNENYDVSR